MTIINYEFTFEDVCSFITDSFKDANINDEKIIIKHFWFFRTSLKVKHEDKWTRLDTYLDVPLSIIFICIGLWLGGFLFIELTLVGIGIFILYVALYFYFRHKTLTKLKSLGSI